MKPKHQRLGMVTAALAVFGLAIYLLTTALSESMTFFYLPSELAKVELHEKQLVQLGGLVEKGSIKKGTAEEPLKIEFVSRDDEARIHVTFVGVPPSLFREGQGIVAKGYKTGAHSFRAVQLLAKHDENYEPRLKDRKNGKV